MKKTLMYVYPYFAKSQDSQTQRQVVWLMVENMRIMGMGRYKIIASASYYGDVVIHLIDER